MKKLFGTIAQVATTGVAALINPALAVVVGGAFAGGEAGKRVGKRVAATGLKGHKLTGPLGALAVPAILAPLAGVAGLDMAGLCETVQSAVASICSNPAGATAAVSSLALLMHGFARNATR